MGKFLISAALVGGSACLTRIVIVWLALRDTVPGDRAAILRSVALLFASQSRIRSLAGLEDNPQGVEGHPVGEEAAEHSGQGGSRSETG